MYYYFSSNQKIALKFDGVYYGVSSPNSVKGLNLESDSVFVEIFPVDGNGEPVNFLLNDTFLSSPPKTVSVTDLKGGFLINVIPETKPKPFKLIKQQKINGGSATLFCDNGLKFSIETQNDFFADGFDFYSEVAEFNQFYIDGELFIYVYFSEICLLNIYSLTPAVKKVLTQKVSAFSVENGLYTTEKIFDIAKHVIETEWGYDKEKLYKKSQTVNCSKSFDKTAVNERLIPYVFIEEYVVKGDFLYYLSEKMQKNAKKLYGYLGEVIGIMPPPPFRKINEIGLIYKKQENVYYVDYLTAEIINGKIDNIKRSEK